MEKIGPTRDYSDGILASNDEGDLIIGIAADKNDNVLFEFGTGLDWFSMPKDEAIQFAKLILECAGVHILALEFGANGRPSPQKLINRGRHNRRRSMEDVNHSLSSRREARQQQDILAQSTTLWMDMTKVMMRFQSDLISTWGHHANALAKQHVAQLNAYTQDAERIQQSTQQASQV